MLDIKKNILRDMQVSEKQLQEIETKALGFMSVVDEVQKKYANRGEEVEACLIFIHTSLKLIFELSVAMQGDRKK